MAQKEGRPDWLWVGRDFPRTSRKYRTNNWALTATSLCTLVAAKDGLFSVPFPSRYRIEENEASLAAIMVQKEDFPDWRFYWPRLPHDCPEIAPQSLGINGALFLDPNRG